MMKRLPNREATESISAKMHNKQNPPAAEKQHRSRGDYYMYRGTRQEHLPEEQGADTRKPPQSSSSTAADRQVLFC